VALPYAEPIIGGGDLRQIVMEIIMEQTGQDPTYVFPTERKLWIDHSTAKRFSIYYGRILSRIGIEGVSFHCLRHSFATRLKRAGNKDLKEIGTYLGHSNEKTTAGYAH
jgi:integrase